MHHLPAGPSLVTRVTGALTRSIRLLGRPVRRRSGRLALGALAGAILTALVLASPGAGTAGTASASLDPSSSSWFTFSSSAGSSSPRPSTTREAQGRSGADGRAGSSSTRVTSRIHVAGPRTDAPDRKPERRGAPADVVVTTPGAPSAAPAEAPPVQTPPVQTPPAQESPVQTPPAQAPPVQAPPVAEAPAAPKPPSAPAVVPVMPAPSPAPRTTAPTAPTPPAASPQTAQPAGASEAEAQVLTLVNAERAAAGCRALVADPALAAVARAHSQDMRDRGFFSHTNPDDLSPFQRAERAGISARAENIARGQEDAAAVMDAWMNSSGHRANILNCGLTRLGVGVAEGSGGPWWTQLFA
ncbi:CAP domain-containing protein [Blastococcus mobilis]|uniref:Uncharacterized conserved protein YkwD, contains CAP (CSP/antigen 5/PR1) domain n=1 Tax=Blastococcus mobilis TaxID=1938746 RepID=A0A238XF19_9ACTN|nr:CAP domain-containing protein [Blastococcus mobilis]SNR57527.1 Uncharacterized conserved protein YkwD, contains CAP (CSP/antigen 5/PR1) domain [Blastococcus mobilis]